MKIAIYKNNLSDTSIYRLYQISEYDNLHYLAYRRTLEEAEILRDLVLKEGVEALISIKEVE